MSVRPIGPCQHTPALAGPIFSYLENSHPTFPGGLYNIYGRLNTGVGRPHGGFPDLGYLNPYRPQAPYQLSGTQRDNFSLAPLGYSDSGPPGYDRYGNTTVVSYINKQGWTHSPCLLCLVVDLFMWLQAQDKIDCLNVIAT